MGAILGLIFVGIANLLILCFFAMNRWNSPEHDREGSAALRANRHDARTDHGNSRGWYQLNGAWPF